MTARGWGWSLRDGISTRRVRCPGCGRLVKIVQPFGERLFRYAAHGQGGGRSKCARSWTHIDPEHEAEL